MSEVLRYDNINLDDLKLKETPEGYLEGFAVATRVGVFSYMKADGTIQREFRPPEEVFNEDSMNSFKMLPITDDHPDVMVNADNAKDLSVGMTGQEIKKIDNNFMAPYVKITDKKSVAAAKQGMKKGLSWGYKVNLVKKDGVHNGERYDYVQTNIRGNHLAIVHQGRAGSEAKLRTDSQDAMCVFNNFNNNNNNLIMKKYKLDGKEIEVSEEVFSRLDALETEITSLKNTEKETKTKIDSLQGECDGLKDKLKSESKKDTAKEMQEEVAKKVKARLALVEKTSDFIKKDEDISELSDRDVQVKAIQAVQPEFKADDRSDEYIAARFDTICEFKKDKNLGENFKIASEKNDSDGDNKKDSGLSNKDLQAGLINRSTKKGE
jgi:uncharacterized protein